MLLHYCCGCGKVISQENKLCPDCIGKQQSRHIEYNKTRRNKQTAKVYTSAYWRKVVRPKVLAKFNGLDIYAIYINSGKDRFIKADMIHHIIEVSEDFNKRYDIDNLIPLSYKSHAKISKIYEQGGTAKVQLQAKLMNMCRDFLAQGGIDKIFSKT